MPLTASKLREDIYRLLDQVLETGKSIEVERGGKRLRIVPVEPVGKLNRLEQRSVIKGDPEDLIHLDWSKEWKPKLK